MRRMGFGWIGTALGWGGFDWGGFRWVRVGWVGSVGVSWVGLEGLWGLRCVVVWDRARWPHYCEGERPTWNSKIPPTPASHERLSERGPVSAQVATPRISVSRPPVWVASSSSPVCPHSRAACLNQCRLPGTLGIRLRVARIRLTSCPPRRCRCFRRAGSPTSLRASW